ncbi:MAG: alanine--tRNA ligase [Clostridiaceae bacterium]|nr:alanine--tRNA ligase [Clostridiaceae bacterium]
MEWTGLNELREKYLSFFESKGHLRLESFSLIPKDDKSLLLINSGMAPMKKYFTGEITPPRNRVTTCQKCIRTPDIESVGKTARHGTYFEMLGNFSFGDYFKKEAIAWAWEFLTDVLGIPADRLWITIYESDDEAEQIWENSIGIPHDRIVRLGKKDNFWEHGSGPCGPCSEIHFDRGESYGPFENFEQASDCDRIIEIWNLVFSQFDSDGEGHYAEMKNKNIDTGMGLERLACVMQNVDNIFEVDTVQNIMKHIIRLAGIEYHADAGKDVSLRVITDHIRSTTMMIGDGVMPSNEGRGYVLRRLLRRAARHGRLLGIDGTFLYKVAETVINENKSAYPNLVEKHDFIINVIKAEEESFAKTVDTGLAIFNQMIEGLDGTELSGEDAFKLSDTYGFPIDLTKELLEEKGLTVDEARFRELVTEQKTRARAAHKGAGAEAWEGSGVATNGLEKTNFVGYTQLEADAEIKAIFKNGDRVEFADDDDAVVIVLDTTPFYAESGGQVGDVGILTGDGFECEISGTTKTHDGIYLHHAMITSGESLKVGDKVRAKVDETTRQATMRNHTAAHLLQAALRKVLGSHVEQAGSFVNPDECRFDFTHFSAMTSDEIANVEQEVNAVIMQAVPVVTREMPIDEAKKLGAMALFGEKYGDVVRVVKAGDFSTELCGGTHAENTGNLGLFKIISESSVASGVRRITAVTGFNTVKYFNSLNETLYSAASALKLSNVGDLVSKATAVTAEIKDKDREIARLNSELNAQKAKQFDVVELEGLELVANGKLDSSLDIRSLAETIRDEKDNRVVVLGSVNSEKGTATFVCACSKKAIEKGVLAGNVVREVAKIAGGNGGGKPDFAMAGGKDVTKVDDAIMKADEIVKSFIK